MKKIYIMLACVVSLMFGCQAQAGTWSTPVVDHTAVQVTPTESLALKAASVDPKYTHSTVPIGSCNVGVPTYYFYQTSFPNPPLGRGTMTFWRSNCI